MRIYLPATMADLEQPDGLSARIAHALTPALARTLGEDDTETGELHALLLAADASLALVRADPSVAPRRVVVAADVPEPPAAGRDLVPQPDPSAVVAPAVRWEQVASLHVDEADEDLAARIRESGERLEHDLLWYDVTERELLLSGG